MTLLHNIIDPYLSELFSSLGFESELTLQFFKLFFFSLLIYSTFLIAYAVGYLFTGVFGVNNLLKKIKAPFQSTFHKTILTYLFNFRFYLFLLWGFISLSSFLLANSVLDEIESILQGGLVEILQLAFLVFLVLLCFYLNAILNKQKASNLKERVLLIQAVSIIITQGFLLLLGLVGYSIFIGWTAVITLSVSSIIAFSGLFLSNSLSKLYFCVVKFSIILKQSFVFENKTSSLETAEKKKYYLRSLLSFILFSKLGFIILLFSNKCLNEENGFFYWHAGFFLFSLAYMLLWLLLAKSLLVNAKNYSTINAQVSIIIPSEVIVIYYLSCKPFFTLMASTFKVFLKKNPGSYIKAIVWTILNPTLCLMESDIKAELNPNLADFVVAASSSFEPILKNGLALVGLFTGLRALRKEFTEDVVIENKLKILKKTIYSIDQVAKKSDDPELTSLVDECKHNYTSARTAENYQDQLHFIGTTTRNTMGFADKMNAAYGGCYINPEARKTEMAKAVGECAEAWLSKHAGS